MSEAAGPIMEFFVVALPGLEDVVATEMAAEFPKLEARAEHGGLTVFAPMAEGLELNLRLRTPTRILMRVKRFRCRDFPKLYNTIRKMPWRKWVDPACTMAVHASTRVSRLKIKSRIEETCLEGWTDYAKSCGREPTPEKTVALYVRFHDDTCTLSLDTSGERLHKRGERQLIGEAPMRETIAAALILRAEKLDPVAREVELVDPMAGSGTFLLEAGRRYSSIEARSFAFENFTVQPLSPTPARERPVEYVRLVGIEIDGKALEAAKSNTSGLRPEPEWICGDVFTSAPFADSGRRRWLFCNPPYGERLRVEGSLTDYYERLFAACERVARPHLACFILPAKAVKGKFMLPRDWKVVEKRPFLNGGIPVIAFTFAIPRGTK